MLSSTFLIRPSPPGISNACLKAMVIIKLGTTCAIYPRLENRVEVELWYFKFQVLANIVRKCRVIHQQDAVLERITVGFFDKFS